MNKIKIIFILLISTIISGCTLSSSIDTQALIEANSQVQNFLEEYPNANIQITYFSFDESLTLQEEFESNCAKTFTQKELYRFSIQDTAQNLELIGFLDSNAGVVECVNRVSTIPQEPQREFLLRNIVEREISIENRPTIGNEDAPVQIIMFGDIADASLKMFMMNTFPLINEIFIKEDLIKLSFKHIIIFEGSNAPNIGECFFNINGDENFFRLLEKFELNSVSNSENDVKKWITDNNFDNLDFDECIDNQAIELKIKQNSDLGWEIGALGSPTFLINNKIMGACPFHVFEEAIQLELENRPFYVDNCQIVK